LGSIEPHAPLLSIPPESQLLYKVMTVENLLRSVTGNYLYFNCVDSYSDFKNVDENDQSRARTYACCFSIENSDYIWKNYANENEKGKACVVFEFGKHADHAQSCIELGRHRTYL